MHGDFSRLTYTTAPLDTDGGFAAVLGLQGRLTLEADANENVAILAHFLRTLVTDLVGPGAGPAADAGFAIERDDDGHRQDLLVGGGRYYVGGLLAQTAGTSYLEQPVRRHHEGDAFSLPATPAFVYLKVWERLITAVEDPGIREVALGAGGPDTAARSKVVWEVVLAALPKDRATATSRQQAMGLWTEFALTLSPTRGRLRASAHTDESSDELCALSPGSQFRGVENQLYRVEIHGGGEIPGDQKASAAMVAPTFKWSRDNGSVIFPIEKRAGAAVTVSTLGRDDRLALDVGDWVEVVDDRYALAGVPAALRRVIDIHPDELLVTLDDPPAGDVGEHPEQHPFLRRWDQDPDQRSLAADNAIVADGAPGIWMELEDGVRVRFEAGSYRSGDFWTIPARVETGDVIWPISDGQRVDREPEGISYFYAPLAYLGPGGVPQFDLRCLFPTLGCKEVSNPPPVGTGTLSSGVADTEDEPTPATQEKAAATGQKPASAAPATRRRTAAKPKPKPQ
jgi:hypothetical protein